MGDGNQAGGAAAAAAISYAPNTFAGRAKLKDIFGPDGWWQAEVNKRNNKDAALYPYYQINPYTKKCRNMHLFFLLLLRIIHLYY